MAGSAGAGAGACAGAGLSGSLRLLRILADGQALALHRTVRDKITNRYFFKIRMLLRKK